jgi:hypothetical protein
MEAFEMDGTTFDSYAKDGVLQSELNNKYYQQGVPLTGVPSYRPTDGELPTKHMHLYKNGVMQTVDDGWRKAPRASNEFWKPYVFYYFKNNLAISNKENVKLTALKQGKYKDSSSYYYTFRGDGRLVTNMLSYWGSKYKSKLKSSKFRIYCDHTTYTGTILMYNSKTKNYDIPIKSFVISMSKSKSYSSNPKSTGTKYGNYALASGSSGFYKYRGASGNITYFGGSQHIWGSGSMFHGAGYKKANRYYLKASSYNQFGGARTAHCVRVQNINYALIHAMYNESGGKFRNNGRYCASRIRVYLQRGGSSKQMRLPFGTMTLTNNFDFNGYILQGTDGYGNGKDMSFDPTDHNTKGKTIYVSSEKTSSKSNCEKVKMTGYKGYELYYDKA